MSYIQTRTVAIRIGLRRCAGPLAVLVFTAIGLWNLAGPALWWDEGWTLSVARTWVERGHYGRLLDGQLIAPGLEASFTVTAPIALSFRLFGVGVWQGRLVGALFTAGAVALMYLLALRLYNRPVALGTLFALLLMPGDPQLHPLVMGRQALAELPMLCYLLAGYACLLLAFRRPLWVVPAALGWGIALVTKVQLLPFWTVALMAPLLIALLMRRWRAGSVILAAATGALAVAQVLPGLWHQWLGGQTLPVQPVSGLYAVTAFVPSLYNRLYALSNIVLFGLPATIGAAYAAWRVARAQERWAENPGPEIVRLSLLALCGSWLAWYMLLSVGLPRYLLPATFLSSIFVSAWLYDLTDQFHFVLMLNRMSVALRTRRFDRGVAAALLAVIVVTATVPMTLQTLYRDYLVVDDHAAQDLADFLNTQTPIDARIETYETELHFLLNRQYHYPPDQVHVELNRRSLLNEEVTIHYDPLADDPDYLVVGGFTRWNKLYAPVIASGAFRLERRFGIYDLYERVR